MGRGSLTTPALSRIWSLPRLRKEFPESSPSPTALLPGARPSLRLRVRPPIRHLPVGFNFSALPAQRRAPLSLRDRSRTAALPAVSPNFTTHQRLPRASSTISPAELVGA